MSSDLYYAIGFLVGDPLIYLELGGRKILLVSDLEFGRAQDEAQVDEVGSITPFEDAIRESGERPRLAAIADLYLQKVGVRELDVPHSFPFGFAEFLRGKGYTLTARAEPLFPERVVKNSDEIDTIEQSQRVAEEAMEFVIESIRKSRIQDGFLYRNGTPLTAEWLRREAHKLLLENDHVATSTIIAGGDQGCDPHVRGHGPLPANQTIIVDIFPRSLTTRYWGDMTRTVVRGKASPEVHSLWEAVNTAVDQAIAQLADGVDGKDLHEGIVDYFNTCGHETTERGGRKVGFIHSTGHGVGLDIHEAPRIGRVSWKIRSGSVVTIEPGLYYPGVGAVRIEDLLVVEDSGSRNLNRFVKELEV